MTVGRLTFAIGPSVTEGNAEIHTPFVCAGNETSGVGDRTR
jgi:hypothetical protein